MPNYTKMQTFTDGQIVGRGQLNTLRDNDNYFWGLASRWRPCFEAPIVEPIAGSAYDFWNGYHLLRDDAMTLYWWFQVTGGATHSTTGIAYYYKDNGTAYELEEITAAAGQTATSTVGWQGLDLSGVSGISAGLHRVRFRMFYSSDDSGTGQARPPWTTYTGSEVFTVPPVIRDEAVSKVGDFNTWRTNDEYFQACSPTNPAFHMIHRGEPTNDDSQIIWDGWNVHTSGIEDLYYSVYFSTDDNNNKLHIYYDYGGSNQTYAVVDTAGSTQTGHLSLTSGTYTNNAWYRVVVEEQRTNGTPGALCYVNYLYMTGDPSGFTLYDPMPDFTVGDWMYGDDDRYPERLQLFSAWDGRIFKALCWDASVGRADFAVRDDTSLPPYAPWTTHAIKHIYDFLWYRGTGVALQWGSDNNRSLPDTDSDNPVLVMDLRSLTNLAYGQHYRITGNVDFAQEAVYSA